MTSTSRSSSSTMIFPEKLVTRDLSNMSIIESYHGDKAASVPFEWESEPGTPKFKSRDPSLPPLTPPPSYYRNKTSMPNKKSKPKKNANNSKPTNIVQTLFVKRATTKQPPLPSPSSSSSSPSSSSTSLSSSSYSLPAYFSAPSSPVIYLQKSEEEDLYDVDLHGTARWSRGCFFMIKKVLPRNFL